MRSSKCICSCNKGIKTIICVGVGYFRERRFNKQTLFRYYSSGNLPTCLFDANVMNNRGVSMSKWVSRFVLIVLAVAASIASANPQPKLVLQITVDALRGDLPQRFSNVLGDGGFRYLME